MTKIYHSNLSEYREYKSANGIKSAVARLMQSHPELINVLDVIEGEQREHYLKYNPWLDTTRGDYKGDVELVTPYKDGYIVVRHFALKPDYTKYLINKN